MWKNNRRFVAAAAGQSLDPELSRRDVLGYAAVGAAGAAAAVAVAGGQNAVAMPNYLRGLGDFRRLNLSNARTGERINMIYFADGAYIPEACDEVNYLLRDWRANEVRPIARRTLDYAAALYSRLETSEPFQVISGYRSPETNELLRRSGKGVAKNSWHMRAMAIDVSLQSRSVQQMYAAAMSLRAGGVGRYSRKHFLHIDCGPQRSWGA